MAELDAHDRSRPPLTPSGLKTAAADAARPERRNPDRAWMLASTPEPALGLAVGDAHMIRNAGGRASDDAIRPLIISCEATAAPMSLP